MPHDNAIFFQPFSGPQASREELIQYASLKLACVGQPVRQDASEAGHLSLAIPLLRNLRERNNLSSPRPCPADRRIQSFLDRYLHDVSPGGVPRLPAETLILDRPGLARVLSLPVSADSFRSRHVSSFRVAQGVLHNPARDRRTTQGLFHIAEGGLPVPYDKAEIPRAAFGRILAAALNPPDEDLLLPFGSDSGDFARVCVSLLLRPLVCPATAAAPAKTMEIRFFAPGSLVSNLDFVEAIFGNAGDPYTPANDSAFDILHWTGHTGCVILAPHITGILKKDLGLPRYEDATERQRRDGMCWRSENDPYNDGRPFKATCRDRDGVIVTVVSDNYFGYCKKEVKTQISYAANLFGRCEEEHAGGAIAFASYLLGQDFHSGRTVHIEEPAFEDALRLLGDRAQRRPEGYAVDRNHTGIVYLPGDAMFSARDGFARWRTNGVERSLRLRPEVDYVLPSGYCVRLEKQPGGAYWHLVGTRADSTLVHKPCTVSGGGKSEISKSIANAILHGPVFVPDFDRDMERIENILTLDIRKIYAKPQAAYRADRPILSPERSLGSVIKLLTPSADYTAEYNARLRSFPQTMRSLLCVIKQNYRPEWGADWRAHFSVDQIDGTTGHELKLDGQKLVGNYLRVGFAGDGSWRIFKLRPDFNPAAKVQVEDDITASTVVEQNGRSVKLVANCEGMLFQRPDDAIHRGFDKQAESDIMGPDVFLSNFEPLSLEQAQELVDDTIEFDKFTEPVKHLVRSALSDRETGFVVSSAQARIVNGKPSSNPRYLQKRPDLVDARSTYLAGLASCLHRKIPAGDRIVFPVNATLPGRRGSPPDPQRGIPCLAVYSPIHYQELPELMMDFMSSLTGKSPSTTGFGSEGALTKRPFNALPPVIDLNNALVSFALTESAAFSTAAGFVGPHFRVDHDISMLVPEVWCRMTTAERDPAFLIAGGYLEKVEDFPYDGRIIPAGRLGYRVTSRFIDHFFARVFETAGSVFDDTMLRPERQDLDIFVAGVEAIADAQRRAALEYFEDGSVDAACPPLQALLHILAHGHYRGMDASHPEFRAMFTRRAILESSWYRDRLLAQQTADIALWTRHVESLAAAGAASALLDEARRQLELVRSPQYLAGLCSTLGADTWLGQPAARRPEPVPAGAAR